jgi:hypothetical protein
VRSGCSLTAAPAGGRLLRVEFTTLFDYLQLLRAIAKTLQVCTIGSADVGHDILMPAPLLRTRHAAKTPCSCWLPPCRISTCHGNDPRRSTFSRLSL